MKKNLLVTLADKNYINQAKQLFSSVYFNAGWEGDYMLFAHEIPEEELKWFIDKGILIKRCQPIPYTQGLENIRRPRAVFDKFYLLSMELKKWKNVVFLDGDIIVRGSLDELTKIKGFAAPNATNINLKKCFLYPKRSLYKRLIKRYPLTGSAFNSGVMAFSTDVIKEDSFSKLIEFMRLYGSLNLDGDEPTFNLLFYKQWKKLPWIYNLYPHDLQYRCHIQPDKIKGIIIHFVESCKPWDRRSFFYKEWQENLRKAELINLGARPPAAKRWTAIEIQLDVLYLNFKPAPFLMPRQVDRLMGLVGIFLKKHNPDLYFKVKKVMHNK
jgi:lipopolysaccharide biosynthesis glycosyltransferase